MTRNLERGVDELKSEIKRLSEGADRRAWDNPHEFVYRALGAVELIRKNSTLTPSRRGWERSAADRASRRVNVCTKHLLDRPI